MALVLVVDDEPNIRTLVSSVVEKKGHKVLTAGKGSEAWGLLDQKPDLLLMDIDMPGETGVEFVMRMRTERGEDTPVIFISAHPERSLPLRLADRGKVKVLGKPFRVEQLAAALDAAFAPEG